MENEAEFEPVEEIVSKSQLKRESLALQALGKRLAALSPDVLDRMPLDPPLREAIALAQRIDNKRSALKRQYQFIGKLLRARDVAPITTALDAHEHQGRESIRQHHRAEQWRDRIVADGDAAIDALVDEVPAANRQKLRQLRRNHEHAGSDAKRTQYARELYREIFRSLDSA